MHFYSHILVKKSILKEMLSSQYADLLYEALDKYADSHETLRKISLTSLKEIYENYGYGSSEGDPSFKDWLTTCSEISVEVSDTGKKSYKSTFNANCGLFDWCQLGGRWAGSIITTLLADSVQFLASKEYPDSEGVAYVSDDPTLVKVDMCPVDSIIKLTTEYPPNDVLVLNSSNLNSSVFYPFSDFVDKFGGKIHVDLGVLDPVLVEQYLTLLATEFKDYYLAILDYHN